MLALTYHSISDGPPPLCIGPERLGEQLDALALMGWRGVRLAEIEERLARRAAQSERVYAITFDDGYRDFATAALPVLQARGLPATLFALPPVETAPPDAEPRIGVPGGIDAPVLSAIELRSVADAGIEIGAHSRSHCDLTRLSDARLEDELTQARDALRATCGTAIERLAYPFGRFDARVRAAAARHFRSAYTTQLAAIDPGAEPMALPRVDAYYLDAPALRRALADGQPGRFLTPRRWLRRLRGSEPRRAVPAARG